MVRSVDERNGDTFPAEVRPCDDAVKAKRIIVKKKNVEKWQKGDQMSGRVGLLSQNKILYLNSMYTTSSSAHHVTRTIAQVQLQTFWCIVDLQLT